MTDLLELFKGVNDTLAKQIQLAAIWRMSDPTYVIEDGERKRTVRIAAGQQVRIENGKLVGVHEGQPATHTIQKCFGNLNNTDFSLQLISLDSDEQLTINLV